MYDSTVKEQTLADIQKEPLKLPENFFWSNLNLNDDAQAKELYDLLTNYYVEDLLGKFRFDY